jgi:uncharacterized membrane protein (DUF2068 family)
LPVAKENDMPQKPGGVVVLAVFYFLGAAFLLCGTLLAVGISVAGLSLRHAGPMMLLAGVGVVGGTVLAIFAALAVLIGWGLWTLRNWARVVAIVLAAGGILVALPGLFAMGVMHWGMMGWGGSLFRLAINGLIIWYLLQPHVKQAFGATSF